MGYLIPKARETKFLLTLDNYIQQQWQRIYQGDIDKAYPRSKVDIWHRYLQFSKDRGMIYDFHPIGNLTRREIIREYKKYDIQKFVYYFDFVVFTPVGVILDDVWCNPLPMLNLQAIWKVKTKEPVRIITAAFINEITSAYPEMSFLHKPYEESWENRKLTYSHIQ